jgi:hypothetical protein
MWVQGEVNLHKLKRVVSACLNQNCAQVNHEQQIFTRCIIAQTWEESPFLGESTLRWPPFGHFWGVVL